MEYSFQYTYIRNVNKKENILNSALDLLSKNGLHNTPMSAIAKAAGTGMGTIYNHFPNKEILINEIYVNIKGREKSAFPSYDIDQPIKTQFESYLSSIIFFFIENPVCFEFMEQLQASPIITEDSRAEGLKAIEPVKILLYKGKKQRIIKDIDNEELLMFVGGAVLSYLRWYFSQPDIKQHSLSNLKRMVWDAIKE
ncbi:TetR/AcrR family transcriptional regulator [Membranihabitans marinus]|uniref:TetR/AcrR family transcriptional regulator n=1 Tax=Membranihabitans marinus TaxID=1227546 RepID=UPI0021D4289F|nr:TetR/AcrR family transcriptional regulator [Membranihabitans marinus]